ncbi:MAG: 16S rRNA (adenine(1518)-N(6)/adenine(1519)-N(6))-dimethyltransferase, partial [Oscillospiraceae bacterium]|nr:16S rRNA (adenine(1518)-N(6)/adenine(1519)-N(6))-dimethyltransferase [Oscillospiraceae bacterium]
MDLYQPKELAALLERHGFHFSKRMGQNFLIQRWVPEKIAREAVRGERVGALEIGPGVGSLTAQLAPRCEKVVCVELDRTLLPILEETLAGFDNVEVLCRDILKVDLPALAAQRFRGLTPVVCANLPYNITTPALTALLRAGCFADVTVMVQREVARRICAGPGSREYGAFSLLCRYYARCQRLFDVG